ncbi:DUF4232 domain-containing protein [Streptomyces sp. NPDC059783]|uniref:DUF4232 domain-containing protein n=1 Tax=Streptomyces sp. NPDC059783 TaxID=3346944 RepID=UPI00365AC5C0
MLHTRKTVIAAIGLVAALSLTACNGDDGATDGAQPGASASAGQTGGSGDTGGSGQGDKSTDNSTGGSDQGADSSTGGNGGSGTGKAAICQTNALEVNATDNTTDETEGIVTVSFKNTGSSDCRITGFAGVDLKSSLGDTFSVDRNGEQPQPQTLKSGETAAFHITYPVNNTGGSGLKLTDMVVTPPNETHPVTLKWPAGSLPVTDGNDGGKMELGPVSKVSDSPAG